MIIFVYMGESQKYETEVLPMKKIIALLLASFVLLCACTAEDASDSSAPDQSIASQDESVADVSATSSESSDTSSESSDASSGDSEIEENLDPIDFEYKTVYTDKLRTDGIYPYR